MDSLNKVMKSVRSLSLGKLDSDKNLEYAAYGIFGVAALYIFYHGQIATVGLAIGVAMILFASTGGNLSISLIAGALAGLIAVYYSRRRSEGFTSHEEEATEEDGFEGEEESSADKKTETPAAEEKKKDTTDAFEGDEEDDAADGFEGEEDDTEEGFQGYEAAPSYGNFNGESNTMEGFANPRPRRRRAKKAAPPPDHGERAEMFKLGKKYKMPNEDDDKDFHLDAGTTFMNAYKSLKPDQIAAMTKDTQELMATQKQLMSTLSTLKPLIQDGKEMMNMFQGYFGSGSPSTN